MNPVTDVGERSPTLCLGSIVPCDVARRLFSEPRVTHVVAWRVGLHGVLSCQGDAAHGNDYQDAHFEVA